MSEQKFKVEMTCGGCSKSVNGVLTKTKGVEKVEIDLEKKLVTVYGTASEEEILTAIKKTGKTVSVIKD